MAMDYLDYLEENEEHVPPGGIRLRRIVKDRQNPLTHYSDSEFRDRFRMSKESFVNLFDLLELPELRDRRGVPMCPRLILMMALRFYAVGTYLTSYERIPKDILGQNTHEYCLIFHILLDALRKTWLALARNTAARREAEKKEEKT